MVGQGACCVKRLGCSSFPKLCRRKKRSEKSSHRLVSEVYIPQLFRGGGENKTGTFGQKWRRKLVH